VNALFVPDFMGRMLQKQAREQKRPDNKVRKCRRGTCTPEEKKSSQSGSIDWNSWSGIV